MSDLEDGKCESCKFWNASYCCEVLQKFAAGPWEVATVRTPSDFGCCKWENYEEEMK